MIAVPPRRLYTHLLAYPTLITLLCIASVQAGTIVRVSTSVGDYSIELLDDIAPISVENFLNYVNRNAYNRTYLHRVEDDFVVQGGGYRYQPFVGPVEVPADPPIANEFQVSNTRGTVGMATFDGDPNSATSQWFVNLVDNSATLDNANGGYAVFGNVLGNGMELLDAIDDLPVADLGGFKAASAPYRTEVYDTPADFVFMNVEVTERYSGALHVFESGTGLLITSINSPDDGAAISMNFSAIPSVSGVVIEANLDSVIPRANADDAFASYSNTDQRLRIPQLEANIAGSVSLIENLVFVLTDAARLRFTLESYDQ